MRNRNMKILFLSASILFVQAAAGGDEASDAKVLHEHHMHHAEMLAHHGAVPSLPGQDAFGTIQEIVRILEADPTTDWSKVDLENLRQHLIDMNEVVLHAMVDASQVPGGLSMKITGEGRTEKSIRSMLIPHAQVLNQMPQWTALAAEIPGGVTLTVKAKDSKDAKLIAMIRGLGFAGLLAQGAHHQVHHLAMARGERVHDHQK